MAKTSMEMEMTLNVGGLEVFVRAGGSLESLFMLGHDRGEDGYDTFADGDEVIPTLEKLLAFARDHQPPKADAEVTLPKKAVR